MIGLIYIISVFMVTCVTGADIYYDTVARGAYNFGAGPITVHSGATWSIVNNANSAFISSLHVEQDARFFVTSISPLISSTVTLLGVINSIVNDGLISFSAHPLSKDSHYNLLGASFKNNGGMYLTGAGDSDMFLDSIFWENNGLLVFAQYQRTKQNINTGIPLGSIRNNGQICLFNKTFKQTLHDIEGSGCITAEENSAIYLANIQRTISTKQKFQLTDSKSSFIVEPYISKRVFKVEGFGQRAGGASNIISINRAIDRGEWSYDSNTGVLYIGNFLRSAYFNIGKGYDKSKFAIVDLNIVELDFVSRGALAYNGPVPNPSYPCQKCKRAPVDPGAQPTQVLTTITQTTDGAISEQTRLINIEVDDYGLFQYETVDYTPVESTTSTELTVTESDVIELMSTTTMTNSSTSSVSLGINYDVSTVTETSSNGYPVESESRYNTQGEMRSDYLELSITSASVPESISTDSTNSLEISSKALSVDFETSSTELDSAYNSDIYIEHESVSSDVSFVHPATQSMVYKSSFVVDSSSGFNTLAIVSSSTEDQVAEITLLATTSGYLMEANQASFYNSSVGLHSSLVSDKTNVDSSVYMNSNHTSMVTETDDYMTSATPETATTGANSTFISTQGLSSVYYEETETSYLAKATPTTEITPYSSSLVLSSSTTVLLNSSDAHYYTTNTSSIESITEFATLTTVNPLVGANSQDNINLLTFSSTNSTVSDVVAKAAGAGNFGIEISSSSTISQIVQTDTPNEPLLESTVGGIDSNTIEAVSIPMSSASIDSLSSDATTTYMPVGESDSTSSFSSVNQPVTYSFGHLDASTDEIVSSSSTRSSSSTMSSWSVTYSEVSESAVVSSVVTNTTLGSSLTESSFVSSSPVASSTMTESALVESTTSSQPSTTASRSSQGQQSASTMSESLPSFSTMSDSLSSSSTMSESLSSSSTSLTTTVHLQSSESSTTEYYVASQTDATSSDANTDEGFAVTESAWDFHFTNTSTTTEALLTEVTKAASFARVEATAGLTGDVSEIQDNDNGVISEGVSSASSSTEVDSKTVSSSTEAGASKASSSTEADSKTASSSTEIDSSKASSSTEVDSSKASSSTETDSKTDSPSASHHIIPALSNGNTSEAGSNTPTNASKASSNMYTVTTNVVVASSTSNSRAPSVLAPHITTYESSGSLVQFSLSSLVALFATILVSFHL
uniref:Iff51 n=1 Tax=Candida metapsilosis TaxID=273372 RepID=A0A4Y5MXH7_9ASCO|nr:Iff51 [Candida metapsilosis]